ncbi:epoxide hydrolase N-terminal domain-containing protein [Sinorhizobium americanum]|uniref:epoxide hydrolase N-terminal domain-containing protein n=1 Tax=Sinorhizobium americanum TaxID=194963 RepID=UPI001A9D457A
MHLFSRREGSNRRGEANTRAVHCKWQIVTVDSRQGCAADLLQCRIKATRWPEKETVSVESQGVRLETLRELARYWLEQYDWRKQAVACDDEIGMTGGREKNMG